MSVDELSEDLELNALTKAAGAPQTEKRLKDNQKGNGYKMRALLVVLVAIALLEVGSAQAVDGEASKCHFFPYHPSCRGHMSKRGSEKLTATQRSDNSLHDAAIDLSDRRQPTKPFLPRMDSNMVDLDLKEGALREALGPRSKDELVMVPKRALRTLIYRLADLEKILHSDEDLGGVEYPYLPPQGRRSVGGAAGLVLCPDGSIAEPYGDNAVLC